MFRTFCKKFSDNSEMKNYSQTEFINKVKNFTNYNIKHIEEFNFTIKNINEKNFENKMIYNATISFKKDSIELQKHFKNNNIDKIFEDISNFVINEIKF